MTSSVHRDCDGEEILLVSAGLGDEGTAAGDHDELVWTTPSKERVGKAVLADTTKCDDLIALLLAPDRYFDRVAGLQGVEVKEGTGPLRLGVSVSD
jgi:hypothetical protein